MTAMLHAAEEELTQRSNQLDITNEMLRATEAELVRKEEVLDITQQMLRKAEEEIRAQNDETAELRRELASARESLSHMTVRRQPDRRHGNGTETDPAHSAAPCSSRRSAKPTSSSTSASAATAAASTAAAEEHLRHPVVAALKPSAALPVELPEQQQKQRQTGKAVAPTIVIAHGDTEESMTGRRWIRDARASVMDYIEARTATSQRLPMAHTSVVREDI